MAQRSEASIFALEEVWGAGSNPGGATTRFLIFVVFSLIVFLPFCLFLFILTGDLFSFARFLCISSLREHGDGFSFGGDPELTVSPTTIIIGFVPNLFTLCIYF